MDHKPGIRKTAIGELKPHPSNPRQGDVGAIIQSIEANGWYGTLVAQISTGHVLAGNHRLQAAIHCGLDRVPVHWVDVDDDTAHRILLADNRTTDLATYDEHALADLLVEMGKTGNLDGTGYDGDDLDDLLADLERHGPDAVEPPTPAPPDDPITKPGDLILLGNHRLVCGDATDPDVVEQACPEREATLVWTDPPYGIDYKPMRSVGTGPIANDASLLNARTIIGNSLYVAPTAESYFLCCDWRSLSLMIDSLEAIDATPKATLIWDKGHQVQNLDRFGKSYEMIVYAGPYGGQPTYSRDVWQMSRDFEPNHPTPKPVDLVIHALKSTSEPGDLVYDCFAGSGSAVLAAERTGRVARLIELDPAYCDVIVQRWEDHTGETAIRP